MNIKLIKIFSFFIGLFITLAILSYYNVNEKFTVEPEIEKDEKNI
jgi:CHASE3 domain sensor protein